MFKIIYALFKIDKYDLNNYLSIVNLYRFLQNYVHIFGKLKSGSNKILYLLGTKTISKNESTY